MAWLGQQTPGGGRRTGGALATPGTATKQNQPRILSMYSQPPSGEVIIEDFERFAVARLRVLKGIEDAKSRGKKAAELHAIILDLVKKHMKAPSIVEERWLDQVSHFVLRLAHCRSEDLRRWFLIHESELFAARFREEPRKAEFLRKAGLPYVPLAREDVSPTAHPEESPAFQKAKALLQKLVTVAQSRGDLPGAVAIAHGEMDFFLVPYEDVPDLVKLRQVLLVQGQAYVARDQVASLFIPHFRAGLSKGLAKTARKWSSVTAAAEAGRLAPLVESLATRYLGPDFGDAATNRNEESVMPSQIPGLAKTSFPLCMALMTERLHADHHLRHGGRQELGLFLKGIGLPMEEALHFWRQEFAPRTNPEAFNKEYAYNIRHIYGKEGARKNYTPYSCIKMITSAVSTGDCHGCPYKTLDSESLRDGLMRMRVTGPALEEAVSKARAGHFQLACGAAFAGAHGGCECESGINHPNQYYQESRRLILGKDDKDVPMTPTGTKPDRVSGGLRTSPVAISPLA